MPSQFERVIGVLSPSLGEPMARASISTYMEKTGIQPDALGQEHLPELAEHVTRQLKVFLGGSRAEALADRVSSPEADRGPRGMRSSAGITWLVAGLVTTAAVVVLGGWYQSTFATAYFAIVKVLSLFVISFTSFICSEWYESGSLERRYWLLHGIGFLLFAGGQSVLMYHQVGYGEHVPFPSLGDPLFVSSYLFLLWALFSFCLVAWRSGLPLGTAAQFWGPCFAVAILFLGSLYFIIVPVIESGGAWQEVFLNIFYPVASFFTLAPCLVMLRVGLKLRGGRLPRIWLPITIGFTFMLISDVMFAFLTTLNLAWITPYMDFLYLAGYALIARGVLSQLYLMES